MARAVGSWSSREWLAEPRRRCPVLYGIGIVIVMGPFTMATLLIVAVNVFVPAAAGAVYVAVHTALVRGVAVDVLHRRRCQRCRRGRAEVHAVDRRRRQCR